MRRREFIAGLALSAVAHPVGVSAQHSDRKRRLGVLLTVAPSDPTVAGLWRELIEGLREYGWEEGRNLVIEHRIAGRDPKRFDDLAAELAALKVDAILAANPIAIEAARRTTSTIPVIMLGGYDAVGSGWIDSLSRPGHNVTGIASDFSASKHLEILKEVEPGLQRVSLLYGEGNHVAARTIDDLRRDASRFRLIVSPLTLTSTSDLDAEFARLTDQPQALIVSGGDPVMQARRFDIAAFAIRQRLPTITGLKVLVPDGLLMSYSTDQANAFRRAARYVDLVLKGANPAELPVEQNEKFALVINLKTARAIGLQMPPAMLARADEVIE
jgi:putative ABC transport system substrate-binding protein